MDNYGKGHFIPKAFFSWGNIVVTLYVEGVTTLHRSFNLWIKNIVEKGICSINEFLLITNDLVLVNKSWLRLRINVLFNYDWFCFEHVSKAFVRANFVRGQIIGKVFLLRKILPKSPYLFCFCLNGRWWGDPLNQVHPCRRSIPNITLIQYPYPILPYPFS